MFWRKKPAPPNSPEVLREAVALLVKQNRRNVQELTRIMDYHHLDTRGRSDMTVLLKELDHQLTTNFMM